MAAPRPVTLSHGDTWRRAWRLTDAAGAPIPLAGASARLHVRDAADALVLSASTADGKMTIDVATGTISMVIPFAEVAAVPVGEYRFDMELTYASGVRTTYDRDGVLLIERDRTHD